MAKILRESEDVKALMAAFNTSKTTVHRALNGVTKSEFANRIRKRALDMGCKVKGTESIKVIK